MALSIPQSVVAGIAKRAEPAKAASQSWGFMNTGAQALLAGGQVEEALAQVSADIRLQPRDSQARALLFTILCINGDWERAGQQLETWAKLEPGLLPGLVAYERLLSLEKDRQSVFCGETDPPLNGPLESDEDRLQEEVVRLWCAGQRSEAGALAARRKDSQIRGQSDAFPFLGIEDFDSRFGQFLEVFLPSGYSLIPFSRIKSLEAESTTTYLDCIWRSVAIRLNGEVLPAYLPGRYPHSEHSQDPLVRLARKTVGEEQEPGLFTGSGQRLWLTGEPKLEISVVAFRSMTFNSV